MLVDKVFASHPTIFELWFRRIDIELSTEFKDKKCNIPVR